MKLMKHKYNFLLEKPKIIPLELIALLIVILLLCFFLNYKTYDKNYLKIKIFKEESTYLALLNVLEANIIDFNEKTILRIDKEKRDYQIKQISDLVGDPSTGYNYQEIIMQIDLKEKEKIENIYLNLTVLNNYQSLFKKIFKLFI